MTALSRLERLPGWPALMLRPTAASYCDMKPAEFEREVLAGVLPNPVLLSGTERWHRRDLDAALADLTGGGAADWRKKAKLHAQG